MQRRLLANIAALSLLAGCWLDTDYRYIDLAIDRQSIRPAVIFSVESGTLLDLEIRGDVEGCYYHFRMIRPVETEIHGYAEGSIRFSWSPSMHRSCRDAIDPGRGSLVISILNHAGNKVAEEEIDFEVVTNGIYREYDGL